MADILFLAHRLPYPPDKGDKIRSWHILRHLASRHRVHLGAFYDDPKDAVHVAALEKICAGVFALPVDPFLGRVKSLAALFTGEAMSARFYRHPRMIAWVEGIAARVRPEAAFVFCSAMAPYVTGLALPRRIIDMVDLDSEKWAQYAAASGFPLRALYRREATRLLALERRAAASFDATFFVSQAEADLFAARAPEAAARVRVMENGVDLERFDPTLAFANPYPAGRRALVMTGAMDYRPNADAACWFADAVMPRLRRRWGNLDFWIVGSNPARSVRRLARQRDIRVTGRVADVRPYLAHAEAAVAPLRIARGIQNKVLEAMAMGLPVIASPQALAAFAFKAGEEIFCATGPDGYVDQLAVALSPKGRDIGGRARARVAADFRWDAKLGALDVALGLPPDAAALASAS